MLILLSPSRGGRVGMEDTQLFMTLHIFDICGHLGYLLPMFYAISFIFGAIVGSFLNVCIFRIPAGKSIAFPPSHCPKCQAPIMWYDNIPVISYLVLMGKCRKCREPISARYPMVEFITALLSLAAFIKLGPSPAYFIYFAFITALIVITFIDLDHQIIPDIISLPGIPIGFIASFALPDITYKESLIGILAGGGILFLVAAGYELLAKKRVWVEETLSFSLWLGHSSDGRVFYLLYFPVP